MKISVIIPVYNAEQFLERAVLSILKQPEVNEILLVNDNSTDHSLELSLKLKEQHSIITVISHEYPTNQGAAFCRNLGIVNAKNEWLAFLDSDDYYFENRFQPFLEVLEKHPDADGVYDSVLNEFESEEGKRDFIAARPQKYKQEPLLTNLLLYTLDQPVEPTELFESLIRSENGFFQINGLTIKRNLCLKADLMSRDAGYMEDTHFFLKVAFLGKLYPGSLKEPVAVRVVHDANITLKQKGRAAVFRREMFKSLYKWFKRKNYDNYNKKLVRRMAVKSYLLNDLKMTTRRFYRAKFSFVSVLHFFVFRY